MNIFKSGGSFGLKKLSSAMALTLGAGVLGVVFSADAVKIYPSLKLPSFAPPLWVFAPVWAVLVILMGLSLYRILMLAKNLPELKSARSAFNIQLFFILFWSMLFFSFSLRIAALLDILILLIYIILTMIKFHRFDRPAAYLLAPYLMCVAYAAVLNFCIVLLND
jgi:benzodiazapine receptor